MIALANISFAGQGSDEKMAEPECYSISVVEAV
jgi:hypothetical protein